MDGAANKKGSRVGIVIILPDGITLEISLRLGLSVTNDGAEYEAFQVARRKICQGVL